MKEKSILQYYTNNQTAAGLIIGAGLGYVACCLIKNNEVGKKEIIVLIAAMGISFAFAKRAKDQASFVKKS